MWFSYSSPYWKNTRKDIQEYKYFLKSSRIHFQNLQALLLLSSLLDFDGWLFLKFPPKVYPKVTLKLGPLNLISGPTKQVSLPSRGKFAARTELCSTSHQKYLKWDELARSVRGANRMDTARTEMIFGSLLLKPFLLTFHHNIFNSFHCILIQVQQNDVTPTKLNKQSEITIQNKN